MKKPLLYILPFLLLSSLALAEEEWTVRTTKNFVDVCIPGQITHGDTSCFSMKKGNCDVLEHYFSVYTKSGHKNILEMQDKILPIESLGTVIGARVLFSAPFLSGHRVMLSVNQHPVNQYLDFLKEFETFDAKIIDSEDEELGSIKIISINTFKNLKFKKSKNIICSRFKPKISTNAAIN